MNAPINNRSKKGAAVHLPITPKEMKHLLRASRRHISVSSHVSALCCYTGAMVWLAPLVARQNDPDQPA
jgi:hypothetical protein